MRRPHTGTQEANSRALVETPHAFVCGRSAHASMHASSAFSLVVCISWTTKAALQRPERCVVCRPFSLVQSGEEGWGVRLRCGWTVQLG